ncbi:MAG: hypothetical protein FWH27_08960 [Planctomycetaceae bacterium]|nr:hypothetical protein [Planctomycetaceae bacterium]
MTTNIDEKNNDLVFQGMKEAIDLEVQRLRDEGRPILVWRDGKVVDIRQELELQDTGRMYFLLGVAFLVFLPIFFGLIYFDTQWLPLGIVKSFSMLMGVMNVGMFGLGAWYGDKNTRRNCLIFLTVLFPLLACLIYSYLVNGFFADM